MVEIKVGDLVFVSAPLKVEGINDAVVKCSYGFWGRRYFVDIPKEILQVEYLTGHPTKKEE